jgi:phosphoribosyl 1,2-cyclic phosphodiesterase/CheY-like chemotaxis protein
MPAPKKVLIIDDDRDYRRLIAEILEAHGWRVLEANEGEAGLEVVRQHRPEIVLCDLLMPRGNGFLVCRGIRQDFTLRHTRIVITSGRDYEADRIAAREAGADEYLTKPVVPEQLVTLLSRLCGDGTPRVSKTNSPSRADVSPARLKFWGVRGSTPTPGPGTVRYGGNTSCIEVRAGGEIIILDAGTGLRLLGQELVSEFKVQPLNLTLLLSHTHWDHIQGLPFFQPIYQPHCHLRILGYEGARSGLVNVLSGQMESPYFPVPFGELPGSIEIVELKDMEFQVGPVRVQAAFANHPGICVGYRLFTDEGSVAFFPDHEPQCRHRGTTPTAPTKGQASLEYARAEEQKLIEFLGDVDVLIFDAQYDSDEYNEHMGWGHGCVDDAVAVALRAGAKRFFLFHHDPDHDDATLDRLGARAREIVTAEKGSLQVDVAREGAVVELAAIPGQRSQ